MLHRLRALIPSTRDVIANSTSGLGYAIARPSANHARTKMRFPATAKGTLALIAIVGAIAFMLYRHPPLQSVGHDEVGVRSNLLTGSVTEWQDGTLFVLPGLHHMRRYAMRDHTYKPLQTQSATGSALLLSPEGSSRGVALAAITAPPAIDYWICQLDTTRPRKGGCRWWRSDHGAVHREGVIMLRQAFTSVTLILSMTGAAPLMADTTEIAIITQNQSSLRAAPRDSARANAVLWQGEAVEVRGARMDFLQAYDYRRERVGYVRTNQVRRFTLGPRDAPEILSVVRFLRDTPGSEALGIGLVAAYIQAVPPEELSADAGIEALDALGTFADRLAHRVSSGPVPNKRAQARQSAHLDVATGHGVHFTTIERNGRIQICYDGDAFRRVLSLPSAQNKRARAALALTRPECMPDESRPTEKSTMDEQSAEILDQVDAPSLSAFLKNRVLMRRAGVWASLAYQLARQGKPAEHAAGRALDELAGIDKSELTDDDHEAYNVAAMQVSASRWAAQPPTAGAPTKQPHVVTLPRDEGETCVFLVDAAHDPEHPFAHRCPHGIVWASSATLNREGNALAVAVQPTDTWREMWVFRKGQEGWTVAVLPPATTAPDVGYAEFAGWVPGGKKMLVAREARGEGHTKRNFELVQLDTLATERRAREPDTLKVFARWQDPTWKQQTLSLR